jgi:predicted membrane chloride channel (bestrophin family)
MGKNLNHYAVIWYIYSHYLFVLVFSIILLHLHMWYGLIDDQLIGTFILGGCSIDYYLYFQQDKQSPLF